MDPETPPPGKVDPNALDRAVDGLGSDFFSFLYQPFVGGLTVMHVLLIAVGLFVLSMIWQRRSGGNTRVVGKHCKKCNTTSAVTTATMKCPKCKTMFAD